MTISVRLNEKDTELKEGQNPEDNSSQEACFVCHRPTSKAGKMIHLTDEICICQDCMQKTLDLIRNAVLEKIEDEYDLECYNKAIEEYRKNPKTYTMEEVKKELGL